MPLHTVLTKPKFSVVNGCELQLSHLVTSVSISTDNRSTQAIVTAGQTDIDHPKLPLGMPAFCRKICSRVSDFIERT